MTKAALGFSEWLQFMDTETRRWQTWFGQQSAVVFDVPVGARDSDTATIRGMLIHIFFVEMVYGCLLVEETVVNYKDLPQRTPEEIFAIGENARAKLKRFIQQTNAEDLNKKLKLGDPSVALYLQPSKRKAFAHTMLHSTRHWAQVATALRQHGYKQDWQHDFVFTDALP
jgi:uncharacterized damage-inducible protein DinB